MNTFKETILEKINNGEIDMKPRWHFILRAALFMLGVVIVAFVAIYLFSFILFSLHQNGLFFAPIFGLRGLIFFVVSSPWILILLVLVFLVLLYVLVNRYSFSYRKPLVYSMVGVVLFVLVVSCAIQKALVHERVRAFALRHDVPLFVPIYRDATSGRPRGMEVGTITEIHGDGFVILTDRNEFINVQIGPRTKQPPTYTYLPREEVMVFGKRQGNMIEAFGIKIGFKAPGVVNEMRAAEHPRAVEESMYLTATSQYLTQ